MSGFSRYENYIEAAPDAAILATPRDVTRLLEESIAARVHSLLLYPKNLTANFFDLSSREAGEILQKVQSYGLRIAVVCEPGAVHFSTHFHEMTGEVRGFFRIFETREAASEWLSATRKTA